MLIEKPSSHTRLDGDLNGRSPADSFEKNEFDYLKDHTNEQILAF